MSLQSEIQKKRPFDLPEEEVYLNLRRSTDRLQAGFDRLFRQAGVTEAQYNILRILRGAGDGGLACQEVAKRMIARVPDVTRLVDRLLAQGLVDRRRIEEDRRVVLLAATPKGVALVDSLHEPVRQLHRSQLGHLSSDELQELNRLLVRSREKVTDGP